MGIRWNPRGWYYVLTNIFCLQLSTARYQRQTNNCPVGSPGYKPDTLNGCETYFYCHADGTRESFACPYGMLFDERRAQCDLWNNVNCPLPMGLLQEVASLPLANLVAPPQYGPSYAAFTPQPSVPSPYSVHQANPNSNPQQGNQQQGNPMDFLAALLFPPLAGQQDLSDFVNTAPSGIKQSFMRVANEGHLPHGHISGNAGHQPQQAYPQYVEPWAGAGHRPIYADPLSQGLPAGPAPPGPNDQMPRNRDNPATNHHTAHGRRARPSPAQNPLETSFQMQNTGHMQGGPPPQSFDAGPVPPHLMSGHSYMFGQLSMQNQTAPVMANLQPNPYGIPSHIQATITGQSLQAEALKPLFRTFLQNQYPPHLRRMASLLAGPTADALTAKLAADPMAAAAALDPAAAAGGKPGKPGKALDDGLVDARK